MHSLGKQQVDGTQSSLNASRITIVQHRHIGCVALDETNLLGGKRRATRGHGVFHARLVH